jgi:hypothetical protein
VLGLVGAIVAGVRHGAATPGFALLFAGVALRQGLLLHGGGVSKATPIAAAGELAVLCGVVGALLALRSLLRTTRERDGSEDLHWDSMEAVRAISELAVRPHADLSDKLGTLLELGAARFDLGVGVAWCEDGVADGELLALRVPAETELREAWRTELLPRLREAARATRPVVLAGGGNLPVVFASPFAAGGARGALAFAGSRGRAHRFTATDKDLLGLMAVWLAGELERRTRAEAPAPSPEPPPAAPPKRRLPARRDRGRERDLNRAVRRAERGLRRRVGADATLEIALADELPPVASGRLPLATLVESVVLAAARLAPAGRIRVETAQLAHAGAASAVAGGDVMLSASVEGDVDQAALERIFELPDALEPPGALSLARLERMLRRDGADLSIAVEPGRRALLTAYLQAADQARDPAVASRRARAVAGGADQPSR